MKRFLILAALVAAVGATAIPPPAFDAPLATAASSRTAVLAGGCFWGVEAVFEHVRGVTRVTSGYVADVESVEVIYNAAEITFGQLLHVYFAVAHDPTQLNRQGPDVGPEYRSAVFHVDADQQQIARRYIEQLDTARVFARPIVTEVTRLGSFRQAEAFHQDYAARHPTDAYIRINDAPKLEKLRKDFPRLFVRR